MDEGQAYAQLGIEDRCLEDEMVMTLFEIRVSEIPLKIEQLRAALAAIGKARQSRKINGYLNVPQAKQHSLFEWPVGLENIGNTCYLNSLLQFYFSVAPLRDIILNRYDEVKMEMTPERLAVKQVGNRKVSEKEIERAKKCKRRS